MTKPKNIYFIILAGITVRNLLKSNYLNELASNSDFKINVITSKMLLDDYKNYPMIDFIYVDSKVSFICKALNAILRRRGHYVFPTPSSDIILNKPLNTSRKLRVSKYLVYPFPSSTIIFKIIHKIFIIFAYSLNPVKNKIHFNKSDIVISTSPNNLVDINCTSLAYKDKATIICMIKSFDNTSSKGYFPIPGSKYLCWNSFMEDELKSIFRIKKENIFKIGVPQFDIYFNNSYERNYLNRQLKIPNHKPIVLYASNHPELGPDDVQIVSQIAQSCYDINFVVRVHFMDDFSRWEELSFSDNVFIQKPGVNEAKESDLRLVSNNFLNDLKQTLYSSCLVLNTCSTITLDAICCNKECILLAIDLKDRPYEKSVQRFYDLIHYKQILELDLFPVVHSINQLERYIKKIVHKPNNRKDKINKDGIRLLNRSDYSVNQLLSVLETIS